LSTMRFRSRMTHRDGGVDAPKSGAHTQPRIDGIGAKLQKLLQKYHLAVMITASSPSVSKWDRPRSKAEVV
jgi:hypothetical protein